MTTLKKGELDIFALRGEGAARSRLRILAYHAVADLSGDPVLAEYGVAPALFAAQLDELIDRGWEFVDLGAVLDFLAGGQPLPRRALLLTFDDAYIDLLEVACPLLRERGIPALAFAVAYRVGASNTWDQPKGAAALPLLDGEGLRALSERGVEIGSHTATHRSLRGLEGSDL